MTITYKNIFTGLMITLIVVLATWATLSYVPEKSILPQVKLLPDAFMEEVIATVMDKQGKIHLKIVSPKMIHYAENDTTRLFTPQVTLYRKSPNPWLINSKHAQATQGTDNVHFWDNVTIHHAADQNNPATLIKTATLHVRPNQQTAETAELITLIQPGLTVKAIGMHADMNTGNIKLLSNARGEYAPN